jgi:hypothetical protein
MIPNIIARHKNIIDLFMRPSPGATKWRFNAAENVDDAYGTNAGVTGAGTDTMFDVFAGPSSTFRSPGIQRRRIQYPENIRQGTRVIFDPDEYSLPSNVIPSDTQTMFMRTQQSPDGGATWGPEGPIFIIPSFAFYGVQNPLLAISGTAPGLGGALMAGYVPPQDSMWVVLPAYSKSVTILNLSSSTSILVSFGKNRPFIEIIGGVSASFHTGGVAEILIATPTAGVGVPFTMTFEIANFG